MPSYHSRVDSPVLDCQSVNFVEPDCQLWCDGGPPCSKGTFWSSRSIARLRMPATRTPSSPGQNLALTLIYVPYSLDKHLPYSFDIYVPYSLYTYVPYSLDIYMPYSLDSGPPCSKGTFRSSRSEIADARDPPPLQREVLRTFT